MAKNFTCDGQINMFDYLGVAEPTLEDKLLRYVLKFGTGFTNGIYKVNALMNAGLSKEETVKHLKEMYGIGGQTFRYVGFDFGLFDYGSSGFRVVVSNKISKEEHSFEYSWNLIEGVLAEMVRDGTYPKPPTRRCGETNEPCNHNVKSSIAYSLGYECKALCCKACEEKLCGARCNLANKNEYEYKSATLPHIKYKSNIKAKACECGGTDLRVWCVKTGTGTEENTRHLYHVECNKCRTASWDKKKWCNAETLDEALTWWNEGRRVKHESKDIKED